MSQSRTVARFLVAAMVALSADAAFAGDDRTTRFYEDARTRLSKGDTAGAIVQLKNALQQDANLLAAHALLGEAFLKNQQPDQAQEALERALRLGIDKSEIALLLAEALLAQGKAQDLLDRLPADLLQGRGKARLLVLRGHAYKALGELVTAERNFEDARVVDPASVTALLSLAELTAQKGLRTEAMALISRAVAEAPDDPQVWYMKGLIIQQGGDRKGAIDAFSRALELQPNYADARVARLSLAIGGRDDASAAADVEFFASANATEPRGIYLRAVYLGQKGDNEGARAALAAAARLLAPVPPEVLKRRAPELLMLTALVFHGLDEHERARAYLEAVLTVTPGDLTAHKLLGAIYLGKRDFVSAIKVLEPAQRRAPNDPQVLLLLGEAYMGKGRNLAGAELLERAFQLRGDKIEIQTAYGVSLLRGGRRDAGLQQLRTAFEKDPGQPRLGLALSSAYLAIGDGKRAVAVVERVVQRAPSNPGYLNTLGVVRLASGDAKGARKAFDQALAAVPGFPPAQLNLGKLEVQEGRFEQAAARYAAVLKANSKSVQAMHELARLEERRGATAASVQWLEKAHGVDPAFLPVAFDLIDAYIRGKEPAKAVDLARDLEGRAADNHQVMARGVRARLAAGDNVGAQSVLQRMSRVAQFDTTRQFEIAQLYVAAGNASAAAYSLEKALSERPDHVPARALLAEIEMARGQVDTAERRARALIADVPAAPDGYRVLGDLHLAAGRFPDALAQYRLAFARAADTDHALRVFAAQIRSGATAQAVAFLESWLAKHPEDVVSARALAEGHIKARNYPAAVSRLEALLKSRPKDPVVLNNLANALALQGEFVRAIPYAEMAVKVAGDDPSARDTLGWLLFKTGSVEGGLRHLREARLRDPRNPEIRFHLAAVLAHAGQADDARAELKEVLGKPLAFPEAAEAEALGRKLGLR
jgi:cellulose synthase operon protein C